MKNKLIANSLVAVTAIVAAACGSDGLVINGVKDPTQLEVRRTPIDHYVLPSEVVDPVTNQSSINLDVWTSVNLAYNDFSEQATPGHDLWAMLMDPTNPMGGWVFVTDTYKTPGPGWPNPNVNTQIRPAAEYIAAWVLSIQNQWFLRDFNGTALQSVTPGQAPVTYDGNGFASLGISIHEVDVAVTGFSPLLAGTPPTPAQQETGNPGTVGANNIERVAPPVSNVLHYVYQNPLNAPAGLLGSAWRESPGQNKHIETVVGGLVGVPVPDYFGGGGPITATGGVYIQRFSDNWQQTTAGTSSTININDGVQYSYYLAAIGNHLIGFGVGLSASSFALPEAVTNEEHIMNTSVVFDLTAFIAAGKKFQFLLKDLLTMQNVVTGDFQNPGEGSTLPGTDR